MIISDITKKKNTMDKINSGFFNAQIFEVDFLSLGFQPKLFVNVPNRTNVKGQLI